jgi:2-phosphosulfolactate phosphatase
VAARLEVQLAPQAAAGPADVAGRVVVVLDVLRASTTIAAALAHGARAIIPFASTEEAVTRAKALERREVILAGERNMAPIPGFDRGNSPREFGPEVVDGKTVLMTTTNGTLTLVGMSAARDVIVGSYVNFSVVLAYVRAALRGGTDVLLACAGHDRQFSLEDAACAGRYVRNTVKRLPDVEINDAARACLLVERRYRDDLAGLFAESSHGRALAAAGYGEDLTVCAGIDTFPVVPVYQDRQITKLGPDRER